MKGCLGNKHLRRYRDKAPPTYHKRVLGYQ